MIYDANDIDRSKIPKANVCIIGSGAAGIAMAHSLIGSNRTVTVLECSRHNDVGSILPNEHHRFEDHDIQHVYDGVMVDPKTDSKTSDEFFLHSRIKAYGGTTNCWEGWTRPLDDMDFTFWPKGVKEELFDPSKPEDVEKQPYPRAMRY